MAANPSIQLGTDGNWAIKEDNLLAYKKDGDRFFNKEFDFTRGSLATFVDKDGLIKVSGVTDTELITNGDFSNWTNDNPDNYNVLNENANNYVTESNGKLRMVSDNSATIAIRPEPNDMLTVGKIYKVSVDLTFTTGTVDISGVQFNTSGTKVFHLTAPAPYLQIAKASTLDVLIDNVSVKEIQTDTPRIDFSDTVKGALLLEPQSTNLIQYSEDFSNGSWNTSNTRGVNFVPTDTIDPQGQTKAYKVTSTASNNQVAYVASIVSGQTYTNSIYVKRISGSGNIILRDVNNGENHFQLSINDGWKRIQSTATSNSTNGRLYINLNTIGDVIEIWGAQQENLSYATSYIPTYGSTATRNLEVCNNSGSAQDFNSEEGVLYAEIAALADDGTSRRISLSNGSTSNTVEILFQNTGTVSFQVKSGNSFQGGGTFNLTQTEFNKIAVKYKANDLALWVNGLERSADNSANTPIGLLELAFDDGGGGSDFYGKTKNLKVFKRAMSDGELYLLTVPQYQSYQEMATALNYTL